MEIPVASSSSSSSSIRDPGCRVFFPFVSYCSCWLPYFGKDFVSDTATLSHSTQETTHFSHHPPLSRPSIYPFIDCHYSWTPVIPLLEQLRFLFPPLSTMCMHACVCACMHACVHACMRVCMRACVCVREVWIYFWLSHSSKSDQA